MNKIVLTLVVVAVIVVTLGTTSLAYAQSPVPPTPVPGTGFGLGRMGGGGPRSGRGVGIGSTVAGQGILHDTMIAAFALKLDIPVADLEARLEKGETMAQIAFSKGLTVDQFRTLMTDARTQAISQAVTDGKLTQQQADWMNQRGFGLMGGGRGMRGAGQGQFANPACPYYTQPAQ